MRWLSSEGYSYALTLKPNNPRIIASEKYLHYNLNRFHRDLDRQLLGTRFSTEKNGVRRTKVVAIFEGLPDNGHIHAAVNVSPGFHDRFEVIMAAENRRHPWMKSVPGGTVCVETILSADGWFEYTTKRFAHLDFTDNVVFLPLA